MAKKFPTTLYVKVCEDGGTEYFTADDDMTGMVDMGERAKIATYKLTATQMVQGVTDIGKAKPV